MLDRSYPARGRNGPCGPCRDVYEPVCAYHRYHPPARPGSQRGEAHGIGCQNENPVAQVACRTDQFFHFGDGENIGQRKYFGGFDNVDPLPVAVKDMFPEKLQTIAINFDGTPGMGLDQVGKILFPLFQGQLVRATIKMFPDPAHRARVGINCFLTFALELEQTQVTLVKFIKSIHFGLVHGIYLPMLDGARNWATLGGYNILRFFPAA